ncbi:DUF262 domain-containing protein [Aphanizomenon sp. CS-733/32]|uniref:DUF262 domain-containing protein n=1 Tax=Aphanizomenon sp. CS-733/32 TaxID=3021715 RepID=UPI00232CB96C|nr:DUF262 domain-containing protein [Aphanizomenon sp. CS-733/32]MDB9308956.1 DUF262 domain-containing protein [Aphanizomenon sp. CS-733/32]
MSLLEDIKAKTKEFRKDSYPMSIGEIISIYNNDELIINPEFQRYFRWSGQQKSKFIESILLGIPTPSIFVYQREDGVWELVDGLQRISTILEFVGSLKDENGNKKECLQLEGTKILPSLKGVMWEGAEDEEHNLSGSVKLDFKRAKIQIEIIQKESDINAKFEIFERLNTGGSFLSYQEVRNCLLIMIDKNVHSWLCNLADNQDFQNCISISDRLSKERYDMELILRYIACSHFPLNSKDVNEYLTDSLTSICQNPNFDLESEKQKFYKLFSLLNKATGEGTFKKYDSERFKGQFLESAYEAITVGLGNNINDYSDSDFDVSILKDKVEQIWSANDFTQYSGSGSNAKSRIPKMVQFGIQHFQK